MIWDVDWYIHVYSDVRTYWISSQVVYVTGRWTEKQMSVIDDRVSCRSCRPCRRLFSPETTCQHPGRLRDGVEPSISRIESRYGTWSQNVAFYTLRKWSPHHRVIDSPARPAGFCCVARWASSSSSNETHPYSHRAAISWPIDLTPSSPWTHAAAITDEKSTQLNFTARWACPSGFHTGQYPVPCPAHWIVQPLAGTWWRHQRALFVCFCYWWIALTSCLSMCNFMTYFRRLRAYVSP